ncbi:PRC-barrel domain-containing protein [Streptomyces sp. NPDC048518]|uniref:PRC-barrel domain-containing protein n=1 Tax=Streptomyces sp. NPDC048518 TaxID=3155029 RepID=UPI00340274B9
MADSLQDAGTPNRGVSPADLVGYEVEASDGSIGEVDPTAAEVAPDHLVVDTGGTLLSKKVLLPLWVVAHVDHGNRTLHVPRTKEHIKAAPRFDRDLRVTDPSYRAQIDRHYLDEPGDHLDQPGG